MSPLEEQKQLIEYLESLLAAERKKSGNSSQIADLEEELRVERLEYGRLLRERKMSQPEVVALPNPGSPSTDLVPQKVTPELHLCVGLNSESRLKGFWSSLKSVLGKEKKLYHISAQPVGTDLMLSSSSWYRTIFDNLMSYFKPEPKDYSRITAAPIATDLLLNRQSLFRILLDDLKVVFSKPDPSKLHLTAQPLEIEEVFKDYKFRSSSVLLSALLHVAMITIVVVAPILFLSGPRKKLPTFTEISLLNPKMYLDLPPQAAKSGGGGGGGDQSKTPASRGKLPKVSDRQFTPPTTKVINLDPILPMEPTVIAPQLAQLPTVNLSELGDPMGLPGPPSNGPGSMGGIGSGSGGGVGSGRGRGVGHGEGGGYGGGPYRIGGGVTPPVIIYRVEPNYSEEARKAKYQGVVVLQAVVRKDGTIQIIKVVRGLGLGLDENAVTALRQWKFRPATKEGVPVDVALNIEVNFTLR